MPICLSDFFFTWNTWVPLKYSYSLQRLNNYVDVVPKIYWTWRLEIYGNNTSLALSICKDVIRAPNLSSCPFSTRALSLVISDRICKKTFHNRLVIFNQNTTHKVENKALILSWISLMCFHFWEKISIIGFYIKFTSSISSSMLRSCPWTSPILCSACFFINASSFLFVASSSSSPLFSAIWRCFWTKKINQKSYFLLFDTPF